MLHPMNSQRFILLAVFWTWMAPLAASQTAPLGATPTSTIEVSLVSPDGPCVLSPPRRSRLDPDWTPEGEEHPPGGRTIIRALLLDTDLPQHWNFGPPKVESISGTHRATMTVERHRTVGILGYSPAHGLVERVVTPGVMMGKAHLAIELVLPAARTPGTLDFAFTFGFDRSSSHSESLALRKPITGCFVHGMSLGRKVSSGRLEVAPGDYIISMWPANLDAFSDCDDSWAVPAGTALRSAITVKSGESTKLHHAFDCPSGFSFRVDVNGCMSEILAGRDALMSSLGWTLDNSLEWFRSRPPSAGPGWHFRATLRPHGESSSWTARQLTLSWGKRSNPFSSLAAPLGTTLSTLDRVPPGDYSLEITGPWIERTSFDISVQDDPHWLTNDSYSFLVVVEPSARVQFGSAH